MEASAVTIDHALSYAHQQLQNAAIDSYRLDARLLLEHASGFSREQVMGHPELPLSEGNWQQFRDLVARRSKREPVSHILGAREFWSRPFCVTADTLDPRADSETLIEAVLSRIDRQAPLNFLDLGTGTGCLLLTLLGECPNARGLAVDISSAALTIAQKNSINLGYQKRARWVQNSWGTGLSGSYDVIVSNPPYIETADIATLEPEVSRYEPALALDGGKDGLDCYRELAGDIARLLAPTGFAVLEFGKGQQDAVAAICADNHLYKRAAAFDLAGTERCIVVAHESTNL